MPVGDLSLNGQDLLLTVAVSVLGSSVVAAIVAGLMTRSAERKKQLREQMVVVADAFASNAMEALARLRDFKPTKPKPYGHRNEALHTDPELRDRYCKEANRAVDSLRPLRGRVHMAFAAGSGPEKEVIDQAATVIACARRMVEVSEEFWACCDRDSGERPAYEAKAKEDYAEARWGAWTAVNGFCEVAGNQMRSP